MTDRGCNDEDIYQHRELTDAIICCFYTVYNMVLDCCYAASADMLISGDKDLLSITELPFPLSILSVRTYLSI